MKIATVLTGVVGLLLLACNERPGTTAASDTQQDTTAVAVRKTVTSPADTVLAELTDTAQARILLDSAEAMVDSARYEEALRLNEQAHALYRASVGERDSAMVRVWNDRTGIFRRSGQLEQAMEAAQEALSIGLNTLGEDHPRVAVTYHNMGGVYRNQGAYEEALGYYEQALVILLKAYGEDDLRVGTIYNNMGLVYEKQGAYEEALAYYEQALAIRLEAYGEDHPRVASTYNSMGIVYYNQGAYEEALAYFEKALAIFLEAYGEDHPRVASTYNSMGIVYWNQGAYEEALAYYEKTLAIKLKAYGEDHPSVANTYHNMGVVYDDQGAYEEAMGYYEQALAIRLVVLGEDHPRVAAAYSNIGVVYRNQGAYDEALAYYEQALLIYLEALGEDHPRVASTYNKMGIVYSSQGAYEEALAYFEEALAIRLKAYGEGHPRVAGTYNNMGIVYREQGAYEEALAYYEQALAIKLKAYGEYHPSVADTYHNMGNVYDDQGAYEEALAYYEQALTIRLEALGEDHPRVARTYHNMGSTYREQGNYDQALQFSRRAGQLLGYNFTQPTAFQEVSDLPEFRSVFSSLAAVYQALYQQNGEARYLDSLRHTYQSAFALEEYIQKEYTAAATRQFYASEALPVYEGAIAHFLEHGRSADRAETFRLAEKTKARQLAEKVQSAPYTASFGLPDSLREKEYELGVDIAYYEKKEFEEEYETANPNDSVLQVYQDKLFALRQARGELLETFRTDYPDYYNLRYSTQAISVAGVQDSLLGSGKEALVEYFAGDSAIYVFTILPDTFHIHEVERDFPLQQWVRDMRCGIFAGHTQDPALCGEMEEKTARESYTTAAHQLYQKLFAPVDSLLPAGAAVTIVPDGLLGYVPFEALLTEAPEEAQPMNSYAYLLRDHTLSYAYSATLQKEMRYQQHRRAPGRNLLAVAPSFEADSYSQADTSLLAITRAIDTANSRSQLQPLEYNVPEAEAVAQLVGGELLTGAAATEAAFRERAGDYRLLHLSTHGKANDKLGDYSFLAFQPQEDSLENEWLYNRELYNLDLNADMVVLSACETGIGELRRGEGIISLARGFSYAGAKSIVTSLWSVDDQSAKVLMEYFYANLQEGMPKDKALRRAKLAYLEQHPNLGRSPFFWAAFIPIGDMSPVALSQGPGLVWWIGGAVLLLAVGFFGWRRVRGGS